MTKSNSTSIKEKIFMLFISFFTIISIITTIFDTSRLRWYIITIVFIVLVIFSYKRLYTVVIQRLGTYSLLLFVLPIFWVSNFNDFPLNMSYTILVFMLINYLTEKHERLILNIIGILFIQLIIFLLYKNSDLFKTGISKQQFLRWIIYSPFIFSFLPILLITIEKFYEVERKNNTKREKQLLELTIKDHLTGLYNRKYMEQKLKSIHSIWKRGIQTYSLIMLDIDYFKNYNDFYGHIQGDSCLKVISKILKDQLSRDTDYAFRYGGEEFLIILGFTNKKGATLIAKKIQDALHAAKILHEKSKVSPYITISMGVATIDDTFDSFSDLLLRTDRALYSAKELGRNQIVHYESNTITILS